MKTETVYVADDGTKFATEAECVAHENNTTSNRLLNLICANITYDHVCHTKYAIITHDTVRQFIESNIDEINKILGKSEQVSVDEGWISNVGRCAGMCPSSVSIYDEIEVKYRNGSTELGPAGSWSSSWRESDGDEGDIIAYRILKD